MSTTTLVVLTVLEVVILVAALAFFLVVLTRRLRSISGNLARIAFGVRAVETQVSVLGPGVTRINGTLAEINGALPQVAQRAEELAAGTGGDGRRPR